MVQLMNQAALGLAIISLVLSAACVAAMRQLAPQHRALAGRVYSLYDNVDRDAAIGRTAPVHPEIAITTDERNVVALLADPKCIGCPDRVSDFCDTAAESTVRRILIVTASEIPTRWSATCADKRIAVRRLDELASDWMAVATPLLILLDARGLELRRRVADSAEAIDSFVSDAEQVPNVANPDRRVHSRG